MVERMHRPGSVLKIVAALLVLLFGGLVYFFSVEENPLTGERQRVAITAEQEVQLGLQARRKMAEQFGGILPDRSRADERVDRVGADLIAALEKILADRKVRLPYRFEFHVLADQQTVNAFALPGGQVFVTRGLLDKMTGSNEVAAVLAHEIAHVIHRHTSERMAKQQLRGRIAAAVDLAAESDSPTAGAVLVGQLLDLRYGRQQELESDRWAIGLIKRAGYDPNGMITLLRILMDAGSAGGPEFLQTHPHPERRLEAIQQLLN